MSDPPLFGDEESAEEGGQSGEPTGSFADLWAESDDDAEPEEAAAPAEPDPPTGAGYRAPPEPGEGVRVIDADEAAQASERSDVARRRGEDMPRYGDRPEPPRSDVTPSLRLPLPGQASPEDVERPRAAPPEPPRRDEDTPIISLDPPSDEVILPHWTQPGTGEVPRVIVGDDIEDDPHSAERWMASGSGPRWQEDQSAAEAETFDAMAGLQDTDSRLGALDTEAESSESFLHFDDLNVPTAGEHKMRRPQAPPPDAPPPPDPPAAERPGPPQAPPPEPPEAPQWPPRDPPPTAPVPPSSGGTGGRNMGAAVGVGFGLGLGALFLAWMGAAWLLILVEVAIVLVAVEYFSALRRAGFAPATLPGLVAVAALPLAAYARGDAAIGLVMFLLMALGTVWFLAGVGKGRFVRDLGATVLAVVHIGVLGSFAALLLRVGPVGGAETSQGVSLLLAALIIAVFYDVGGLFTGSRFGSTPLSAASPNKTWEGLGGGVATALLALLIAVYFPLFGLTELSFGQVLLFGLGCSAAAVIGDLGQSLIKRDLGIKDMGTLLPGHGGVFDRCDGMLFVLPTAYYLVRVFFA